MLKDEISKNAREKIDKRFNLTVQIKAVEDLYEELIKWQKYQ